MKNLLFITILMIGNITLTAQNMENKSNTLRLIYPQWQGGGSANTGLIPDLPPEDMARGYYLGSQILTLLAPETNQKTVTVPISLDIKGRSTENGIASYKAIIRQTEDALTILNENNPEKIITLGGDCSVSVVPFTWLMAKYANDVAIVWIDAHSDINLPGDEYDGYHAMALTACMGMGDEKIINTLPAKTDASKVLIVGLRAWDTGIKERQAELGIKSFSPTEVADNSSPVIERLKTTGASKVVIHFDLDVIDPQEMTAAVGTDPDGLKIDETVRIINDISAEYSIVGLTIAEPMPRVAIKIKNMLEQLPLFKD